MKKTLLMMTLLLTLGIGIEATAQNHRHTPRQEELVDTTQKGGVEAFSDTTNTDSSSVNTTWDDDDWSDDDKDFVEKHLSEIFGGAALTGMTSMLFALAVLFILFVLAPVIILIVIFYFINKNRREKMRLAQMAMQQGQPIPDKLLEEDANTVNDEYQKGLRQCFVGVGLMIFLGLTAKEVGFGIGALVFCIGLGKIVAAKMAEKKNNNIK